jgi:hypothetical protein
MQLSCIRPIPQLGLDICPLLLVCISGIRSFLAHSCGLFFQIDDPCACFLSPQLHCCKPLLVLCRQDPDVHACFTAAIRTHLPHIKLPGHGFRSLPKVSALLTSGLKSRQNDFERPRHPTDVVLVCGPAPPRGAPSSPCLRERLWPCSRLAPRSSSMIPSCSQWHESSSSESSFDELSGYSFSSYSFCHAARSLLSASTLLKTSLILACLSPICSFARSMTTSSLSTSDCILACALNSLASLVRDLWILSPNETLGSTFQRRCPAK